MGRRKRRGRVEWWSFNVGGGGTLPVWLALDASFDQGFCGDLRAVARGSLVWWVGFGCQGAQKSLILQGNERWMGLVA